MPRSWLSFPWRRFLERHHARHPGVFRGAAREPLVSEEIALRALVASGSNEASSPILRLFDGATPVAVTPALAPAPRDRTITRYVRRLARHLAEPAVIVNHAQAGHAEIWRRSADLLAPLYERAGMPTGGALLDLFAGSYRVTPFGVHKDNQDVFTFVLSGRKRFLVWTFAELARRFGVDRAGRWLTRTLPDADLGALRASATVLEGEPGDVLYWPADAWHVAESDGTPSVTVGLGVYRRRNPVFLVERAARRVAAVARNQGYGTRHLLRSETLPFGESEDARASADRGRRAALALASEAIDDAHAVELEAWRSAMGFERTPPARARFDVRSEDRVRVSAPHAVRLLERNAHFVLAAGGAVLALPRHDGLRDLVERLGRGRVERVDALERRFGRARGTDGGLSPEVVRRVVDFLGEHHVLETTDRTTRRSR